MSKMAQSSNETGLLIPESIMPQGCDEWHQWRSHGIGGSAVFALAAGVEDFAPEMTEVVKPEKIPDWVKTPKQVYGEGWLGHESPAIPEHHAERGHRVEPTARDAANKKYKADCQPYCIVHPLFPSIRVSLDGYCPETGTLIEIKAPERKWKEMPDYPRYQIAYQAAVLEAAGYPVNLTEVIEGNEGKGGKVSLKAHPLELGDTLALGADLVSMTRAFIQYCGELKDNGEDFPGGERDVLDLTDCPEWQEAEARWIRASGQIQALKDQMAAFEQEKKAAEQELATIADHLRNREKLTTGGDVKLLEYQRAGQVDWERAVKEEYGDLAVTEFKDRYRKAPSTIKTFKLV